MAAGNWSFSPVNGKAHSKLQTRRRHCTLSLMKSSIRASAPAAVTIDAPARLHMGFLDLGGSLGRVFGGIGVALNEIATRISLRPAGQLAVHGPSAERGGIIARRIEQAWRLPLTAEISIEEAIPEHVGLGSGTQLALAIGVGLHRLYGSGSPVREVARIVERGKRSGIGISVFEQGGFIVDGGRGPQTVTPPLLARFEFSSQWRFILVFDSRGQGLHGDRELDAFRTLPPYPVAEAAHLCHILLLRGLPAIAEHDLPAFGAVISEIQSSVGDYFAPAQGGRFTSPDVAEVLRWLESQGAAGIGQTSWGPTGFCIAGNPSEAARLAEEARSRFSGNPHLSLVVASARNYGAAIDVSHRDFHSEFEPSGLQDLGRYREHRDTSSFSPSPRGRRPG